MHEKKSERISLKSLDASLKRLSIEFDRKLNALDTKFEQTFRTLNARIDTLEASLRRMGVLLEEMNGKLSLLLEGYMGHDTRIVGLEERMKKSGKKNRRITLGSRENR